MHYYGVTKEIVSRKAITHSNPSLGDIHPCLKQIYRTRGIACADDLDRSLSQLASPWLLSGIQQMIDYLQIALEKRQKIVIVADFDADGATSCVVALQGLKLMGAHEPFFIVPNRFEYGYGLTPEIVDLASQYNPDVLITVDNGISSLEGVESAREKGMTVLITDHHLPGEILPNAHAIVNPNLPDDKFPEKSLAGVGVFFYILMALRSHLRKTGWFTEQQIAEPNLGQLLDFVALGTVADVVPLEKINRIFVHQGLLRIRAGHAHPGLRGLIDIAERRYQSLTSADLGFALAPRLNAAGRLDDMSLGIQCLMEEDPDLAREMALQLDELNRDRREIEAQMQKEAMVLLTEMHALDTRHLPSGVCLFDENWHQGVIGILASRIKERLERPVIAFAPGEEGQIKGSARSIPGVHIRDVLSEVAARQPKILKKFGGHAMAAGMSIKLSDLPPFSLAFNEIVEEHMRSLDLEPKIYSDGTLAEQDFTMDFTHMLQDAGPWGQAFPEPVFDGVFDVIQCRIVGKNHLKWVLKMPFSERLIDAIAFQVEQCEQWLGTRKIKIAYKLDVNEYQNRKTVQLIIQYLEKL